MTIDRPLGLSESFFHFMHSLGAYVVAVGVRMRGPVDDQLLSAVLERMQARHPLLRVHIASERGAVRFLEQGTRGIPLRSIPRDSPASFQRAMEDEVGRPLPDGLEPRLRVLRIGPTAPSDAFELVLGMDHAICDGASVISLVRDIHEDLGRLAAGGPVPEVEPLPPLPSMETLLAARGPVPKPTGDLKDEEGAVPLNARRPPRGARATRLDFRDLSPADTERLAARCRAESTSVNGALTAAALLATQRVAGGAHRLGVVSNVALRGEAEPPVGDEHLGNFISFVRTSHQIGPGRSFWELARECREAIAARIAAREPERHLGPGQLTWWQRAYLKNVAPRAQHGAGNALAISNTGRLSLAARRGPFSLDAVYAASAQHVIGSSIAVFVWSIGGAMHICVGHPEPVVAGDAARRVIDEMLTLLANLGV